MQLNLQAEEASALLQVLYGYIPQLREEIGSTENYDMREALKAQEAALTGLVAKLGGSIAETNTPDIGADKPPWGG
jgi:uncharacterized protein involved in exopolysaccharide biosynthesis